MRNLKRALSLTLASVMLLGMMVVGSSAASYPDVENTHNVEAIEVLQAIGVMVGDENGNFGPDDQVNRAQMAVVMALLLDLDYDYYKGTNPFWDVPSWAEPYVAACYANGIVSGYNATTYGSGDPVTAVQAASMMMRALGYFKHESDYKAGFELATVTQASKISLLRDVNAASNSTALTRNQVAQLALNTLESTIVDAKDNTLNISTSAGSATTIVTGGQVDYIVRTSTEPFAQAFRDNVERGDTTTTGNTGYTVQLGEQLYNGDLKKDVTKSTAGVADDFERPATRWTYKFSEIGTYADTPDYSYTTSASGNTPADKVRNMGLKGYKWDGVYVENGLEVSTGLADAAALEHLADKVTGDGVLVEVFMDDDKTDTIDTVTVIRTQMMQVSTVNAKEVTLKRLGDDSRANEGANPIPMGTLNGFINVRVVKEDDAGFDVLKNLKEDDYVLVVPVLDGGSYKVASAVVPSSLSGVLTNVYTKSGDTKIRAVSIDNERFGMSYAWTAENDELRNDTNLSNKQTSTVYFDTYGYVIYVKDVRASNDVIIIDEVYQGLVDGKLVTYVDGWNTNGDEITLNLGTAVNTSDIIDGKNTKTIQGLVYEYASETANKAEYKLVAHGDAVTSGVGNRMVFAPSIGQWIKNGQFQADVVPVVAAGDGQYEFAAGTHLPMATNVKFIFLSIDTQNENDVTGLTIREGVTAVGEDCGSNNGKYDIPAKPAAPNYATDDKLKNISYVLNKDKNKVIAVVVADDEDAAVTENLIFVRENNEHWVDTDGKTKTAFKAYDAQGNLIDNGSSRLNVNVTNGSMNNRFFTYRQDANGVYSVSEYNRTDRITSVSSSSAGTPATVNISAVDDRGYFTGVGGQLNARYATVIDLDTSDEVYTNSAADMAQAIKDGKATGFQIAYIFNGSDNVGAKTVSTVFVLKTLTAANTEWTASTSGGVTLSKTYDASGTGYTTTVTAKAGETVYVYNSTPQFALTVDGTLATKIDPNGENKSSNFSFVMPGKNLTSDKFVFSETQPAVELPAGVNAVNVDTPSAVTITYTSAARPSDGTVADAIVATLEGAGWTVDKADVTINSTGITIPATKSDGGYSISETFKFDKQASSTAYLVVYKKGGVEQDAITDTTDIKTLNPTSSTDGNSYVQVTVGTDVSYVVNDSTVVKVKAGADYATDKYFSVAAPTITAFNTSPYSEANFTVSADKEYAKDDETVTITIALVAGATEDANDTFAFAITADDADGISSPSTVTGIGSTANASFATGTLTVNAKNVGSITIAVTATVNA